MGQAIGGSLPLAVGIALSPIPIIAVVLMLTSRRAKVNGPAFVLGWLVGLGIVGAIVLAVAGRAGPASPAPRHWVSWVKIVLGALLLLVAARQFQEQTADRPAAHAQVDGHDRQDHSARGVRPGRRHVRRQPQNLLLAVAGAAAIAGTGISGGQQAIAYLIFALIGTLGVGIPVGIYFAMGKRSEEAA